MSVTPDMSQLHKLSELPPDPTLQEAILVLAPLVREPDKVRKQRRRFLRAVYDLAQGCPTTLVRKADVAQRLGLDVLQQAGFDEFMVIAQYFSDLGYIRTFEGATKEYREYGMLEITGQGIKAVEENL